MSAVLITCIKPNITREQAARKLAGPLRQARRGRLAAVIDFYIPYRLFQLEVVNRGKTARPLLAIDSVTGRLDPYAFTEQPNDYQRAVVETTSVARIEISEAQALEILQERARRTVYLKGFYKVSGLDVSSRYVEDLHIPYWVGIYRNKDLASLEAIDAVRNCFEGAKVREIIVKWFHSSSTPTE